MAWLICSWTRGEAKKVLALLHGPCDFSPAISFPEWLGRNPSVLYQQWVEKAQQGANKAVHAKDPAAQWLVGPIALPLLLQACDQANQGHDAIRRRGLGKPHSENGPKALVRWVQTHGGYCTPKCSQVAQNTWTHQKGLTYQKVMQRASGECEGFLQEKDGRFQQSNPKTVQHGCKALHPMQAALGHTQHP